MKKIKEILNYSLDFGDNIHISVQTLITIILAFFIVSLFLKLIKRLVNRRLDKDDSAKFTSVFAFLKYFIYILVVIIALESSGVEVSVLLAGSAALLVGIGLGLQTLFQDIISGIFILLDKSLHVNDIIEIEGKVGKVFEIKLRTTRAVTIDDKVLVIPNHKFLTNSLFNWTQNGEDTIETVNVGVAYGSDVEKVKAVLIEVAKKHPKILKRREPDVYFMDFADSSLNFRLIFMINDSFSQVKIKSDLRYEIDKRFREENISIPFPQRDIHFYKKE